MLHNVTFVGKHVIVRLSGDDKVGAVPVLPVDEIAADGEGIIGVVGSGGIVSSKVEHHVQGAVGSGQAQFCGVHLHYLRIAGNHSGLFVAVDGITAEAVPVAHIGAEGDANALGLEMIPRVYTSGIVEHDKRRAQGPQTVVVYRALILGQRFPPLSLFVIIREYRPRLRLPFVGLRYVAISRCHAYTKRLTHSLVACSGSAEVRHPVLSFVSFH